MVTDIRKVFNEFFLKVYMQIKLLKDIVSSVIGPSGARVVDLLYDKKNVNEFLIAKKLNLTINQTRNILYKLADEGLVSFIRKKDAKKGGWYTYFWTLNSGKSLAKFKESLVKMMADAESKIKSRRAGRFFFCENCHIEYDEENALIHSYTCPECGEALILKDNAVEVENLEKEREKLGSILSEVNEELEVIGEKQQKARARKTKAEQKKKENERLARRQEKKRLAEKEGKIKKSSNGKKKKKSK